MATEYEYVIARYNHHGELSEFVTRKRIDAAIFQYWKFVYDMLDGYGLRDTKFAWTCKALVDEAEINLPKRPIGLRSSVVYLDTTGKDQTRVLLRVRRFDD